MKRRPRPGALCVAIAMTAHAATVGCTPASKDAWIDGVSPLRPELIARWTEITVRWPPRNGCADEPVTEMLAVGTLLDRFGKQDGAFFSPRGVGFRARSMPYVCSQLDYSIYRVEKPLPVDTCRAAPWFGEPGGGLTHKSTESAAQLIERGYLSTVAFMPAGGPDQSRPCD